MYTFWKNGADFNVYAEEVSCNSAIKVSLTWEINSKDIAGCQIKNNEDLLHAIIGRNALASKIQVGVLINFEEMKDEGFNEEDIVEVKQLIEAYPDGISWKDSGYEIDKNEEMTDGFPIKVEVVWEKDGENWLKAIEDWSREHYSESVSFFDVIKIEHEQFNIEVDGEVVNVNELMSMVNGHHDIYNWTCKFPLDYMSVA